MLKEYIFSGISSSRGATMKTNRKLVLIAMLTATFLCAMEGTIVSTAMPSIIEDLQGMEYVNMIFSIYLLVCAVTTPIYGKLADIFGRKRTLFLSIILFLIGSFLSGFAHSMTELIIFRAIQALGAGAVLPLSTTIVGDIFSTEERARMQALFGSVWAISGVTGPLIGGFIVGSLNWRWIFYMNIPFGLIALAVFWLSFHETTTRSQKAPVDWAGATAFLISISSLLYILLFGLKDGYFTPINLMLTFVIIFSFIIFLQVEKRAADPFLPLDLFKNRLVLIPNLYCFFSFPFLIATTVYFPIWLQQIMKQTPTVSGLALTFLSVGWPIGATYCARLLNRIPIWKVSIGGAGLLVLSGVLLGTITVSTPLWMFFATMFIAGLGYGLTITVMTIMLQNSVDWSQRGVVMSTNALMGTLGQTIFIALFGTIFNAITMGGKAGELLPRGIHAVFLFVGALLILSFFIAWKLPRLSKEELFEEAGAGI
jgi:EmrB/QacA subfamily drug resistance transporter